MSKFKVDDVVTVKPMNFVITKVTDYENGHIEYECHNGKDDWTIYEEDLVAVPEKETGGMTPQQALEIIGKINLEIPGHSYLAVCESIPQVQEAFKVLRNTINELENLIIKKRIIN